MFPTRKEFVPVYDVKIRGGEHIIEWRYGAHPTVHAFSASKENRIASESSNPFVFPSVREGRLGRAKGAIWADANTGPISKYPARTQKKKSTSEEIDFKITETEDIALRNEVRRAMQNVNRRNMKAILPNLRSLDKSQKGKITFDKVRETLQKNQISLSEHGFRNLGKKFGEQVDEMHVVRYEKLISYLTKLWSEAVALPKKKPTTPPTAGFTNVADRILDSKSHVARPSYVGVDQRIIKMRNRVLFRDTDEVNLLDKLERELERSETINMADIRSIMYGFDRDRNNFLNEGQVYASFQKCGIYLSPEVFQKLLLATDRTGAGAYSIETLISYLIKARPDLQQHLLFGDSHVPRRAKASVLPALSGQPAFASPWSTSSNSLLNVPATDGIENAYEEELDGTNSAFEEEETLPFDATRWSNDFRFLVEALYHADQEKLGFMRETEVRRIANTYILVYSLGITAATLDTALQTAFDKKFNEINLEFFTSVLQELHLASISDTL